MTTIAISLDSKTDVFFPTSEVNGTLFVTTNDPDSLKRINVSIVGCARIYFEVTRGRVTCMYAAEQFYMNTDISLWQNNEHHEAISDGEKQYPFKFVIPSNAAPNISEEFGEIQYYIKANVEFYSSFFGKKNQVEYYGFSVCSFNDLNVNPNLKLNAYTTATKIERKCFSCVKNSLTFTMSLSKIGFVCGEIIQLQIDISNETSLKIESVDYGISKKCFFSGTYAPILFQSKAMDIERSMNIVTNSVTTTSDSINCEITIPALSPSYSECSFLKIEYFVFVKVHTDACFTAGPSTCIPITIGTIPVTEGKVDAMKVLENADFVEGVARCRIREMWNNRKKDGPKEFCPKFPYFSNLSLIKKVSSSSSSVCK